MRVGGTGGCTRLRLGGGVEGSKSLLLLHLRGEKWGTIIVAMYLAQIVNGVLQCACLDYTSVLFCNYSDYTHTAVFYSTNYVQWCNHQVEILRIICFNCK